jgi:hypothetical protein
MVEPKDQSGRGRGVSLPGQPSEEAVAEVGSEAGKSLIRGLGKLGNASISEWTAKREARAEAARLAIETEAKIKTDAAVNVGRREQEVAEFDHLAALERRAARLRVELAREQLNLEAIERSAIRYTESDPGNSKSQELDEDWLFRFADLAQKVSDKDIQALWGRALASAAVEGAPTLSAAALQTLGLFDAGIAESFRKFVAVVSKITYFPYVPDGENELHNIDLGRLFDLGLISEQSHNGPLELTDFSFGERRTGNLGLSMLQSTIGLTRRGYDIAVAVFRDDEDLPLGEELEQQYLRRILESQMRQSTGTIVTRLEHVDPPITIRVKKRTTDGAEKSNWMSSDEFGMLSDRLKRLLVSVKQNYDIELSRTS